MADFVCVMSAGRIRQIGKPQQVYDHPADLFVADFVGKTNQIKATVEAGGNSIRLANGLALAGFTGTDLKQGPAIVAVRPEAIRLRRTPAEGTLRGIVTHRIFLGSFAEYSVEVSGLGDFLVTTDRSRLSESDLVEPGEEVTLSFDPAAAHFFPGSSSITAN